MNYALTIYPPSSTFRGRLERELAAPAVYLNLAELRRLSPGRALARLRTLNGGRLVLAVEDDGGACILPLLKAAAAVSDAGAIEVRHPDLRAEPISRWDIARDLSALAFASARGMRDAVLCRRELTALNAAARIDARSLDSRDVLYLNANLWFSVKAGGSIGHVAGVVNALSEGGWRVAYASAGGRPMIRPEVTLAPLTPPAVVSLPYELNYYTFGRAVSDELGRRGAPRFIYQRMSIANYSGVRLSRQWGVPLVIEYNGSEVWIAKHWGLPLQYERLAADAERACLRHAHVVVTISEVLRDQLIEQGVSPDRIVCYPNCIDPTVFDPSRFETAERLALRQRLGIAPDAVLATFVGTFGQWHGADVLAQAIRRLVDEQPDRVARARLHFLLVGDGLKMPLVREILGEPRYAGRVTLTGLVPQDEAPGYLAASDLLLSPHVANADGTRFFGSPTKLFEYMAMGKAIVASDLDQIGQVLRNSLRSEQLPAADPQAADTALAVLVPPGDTGALGQSMLFAAERAAWRATLGTNARAEALAKYTWAHHVDAILGRLDALVR